MQRIFYIGHGDLSWTVKAAQSLQSFESIVLIFESYTWDQRSKLYGTFKGYQIQKVAGAFFNSVIQLALSSFFSSTGLYSAYSCGFHSLTFNVV